MQKPIYGSFIAIAITAFGMILAPTLSTTNVAFGASFDPFSFGPLKSLGLDKLGLDKLFDKSKNKADDNNPPKSDNNPPKSDNNPPKSDNNPPKSDNNPPKSDNNPPAKEKCGANGGNTKDYYCHGTHHHCKKGQDMCELEGGRTK
jgi:hypothetical protein